MAGRIWTKEEWKEHVEQIKKSEHLISLSVLEDIKTEIEDIGAYEQETNGKTEFVKGITYCLNVIDKYKTESEDNK